MSEHYPVNCIDDHPVDEVVPYRGEQIHGFDNRRLYFCTICGQLFELSDDNSEYEAVGVVSERII